MPEENYNVIGVMSGTSLDGVDLAHVRFRFGDGTISFELLECETQPYSEAWQQVLKEAIHFSSTELSELDSDYTALLGEIVKNFVGKYQLSNIDLICSHGHTIVHRPKEGVSVQIGNRPEIATLTNHKVVCDFRVADVELGGQGAPLVPIGDRLLFGEYDYCLNLGGFSNISYDHHGKRVAFDISPVNTVLNFYANMLGYDYDDGGRIARSGEMNEALFNDLNAIEYYFRHFPKSLGAEFLHEQIFPLMEIYDIPIENILRTFTEHIAFQIAAALPDDHGRMLITGGGAHNDFLIERMRDILPQLTLSIPASNLVEYKEAIIFALLGVLKVRGENNVLASVTGARHDHSAGKLYTPSTKT